MSVLAHLTEMVPLKGKVPFFNFKWLVFGAYFPDGWGLSKVMLSITKDPSVHRDIFFGWTHSLPISSLFAFGVYYFFGFRAGLSFMISAWLHVVTDGFDSIGVLIFWPLSDYRLVLDLWTWTDTSLLLDMWLYMTSPYAMAIELLALLGCLYFYKKYKSQTNESFSNFIKTLWNEHPWAEENTPFKRNKTFLLSKF